MDRRLRVGIHKVDKLSNMETLKDIMAGEKTSSVFWEQNGTKDRAQTPLKRLMRSLTHQSLDQHDLGQIHGNLKLKNILIAYGDFQTPHTVGWKYKGSRNGDWEALYQMLKSIHSTAGLHGQWDCELEHFSSMLRNNERDLEYLRNHFWFHSVLDRARFFTVNIASVHQFLGTLPASAKESVLKIPVGIEEKRLPRNSHLVRACKPPAGKKVKPMKDTFQSTLLFLSHYYSHGMEEGHSAKELEAEVFKVYPTLMEGVYTSLVELGIAKNCWG